MKFFTILYQYVHQFSGFQVLFPMYQIVTEFGTLHSEETSKVLWNANLSIFLKSVKLHVKYFYIHINLFKLH